MIRALQLDPRAAFSHIADGLDVSEQTIARRYRRLRRDGLVRVVGAVDPRALGETDWLLRVRCRPDGALPLAQALARREDVAWVSLGPAGAEVVFALRARTEEARDDLLERRLPKSAQVLGVEAAAILHRFIGADASDWTGVRDALTPPEVARLTATPMTPSSTMPSLDPLDHALLDLLARDGRTTATFLARAVGLSEGRVTRRIDTLVAGGVLYFDVDLAGHALGYTASAYLWFRVAPSHVRVVGEALATHPQVPFAAAVTGPANLVATANCHDLDDLYGYLTTELATVDGIQEVEVALMIRRIKQAGALMDGDRLAAPEPAGRRRRSA